MGVAFNSQQLANSDVVVCKYDFNNNTADAFVCSDMFADENGVLTADQNNDLRLVTTIQHDINYNENGTATTGTFSVSFTRQFNTGEATGDAQLHSANHDIFWFFGEVAPGQNLFNA